MIRLSDLPLCLNTINDRYGVDYDTSYWFPLLDAAVELGNADVVKELCCNGADVRFKSKKKKFYRFICNEIY